MTEPRKAGGFDPAAFVAELQRLLQTLPAEVPASGLAKNRLRGLRDDISQAIGQLQQLASAIDPIGQPPYVLDPSEPRVIGGLIARTLLEQPRTRLTELRRFYGSGVYAIYYDGDFPAYKRVSGKDWPLYVGKADPAVPEATTTHEQGDRLARRLIDDHSRSLRAATNLHVEDFACRYLVVRSAWQATAEQYLIDWFKPVWNNEMGVCYGFGKHGDDPITRSNTRSPWDTLHPGRSWAAKAGNRPNPKTPEQIAAEVKEHLRKTVRRLKLSRPQV